jgi:hypothetical protein
MLKKIITDFREATTFAKSDEVSLFRAMAEAVVKHSNSTFIDETHGGNVCNVSFTSVTGKTETCEIADLLILSLGSDTNSMRATFWQAKKQSVSKWLNVTSSGSQLDFKGQFNQWDLLSRRPDVTGVGTFIPPNDLLSSFTSPSIGSFGVFYEKGTVIEVAHSIAEFIACPSPAAKHPTLSINGYLDKYYFANTEVISRRDLSSFLTALFSFQVGALLYPSIASHQWLLKRVRSRVAAKASSETLRKLDSFIANDDPRSNETPLPSDGLSVLLIGDLNEG